MLGCVTFLGRVTKGLAARAIIPLLGYTAPQSAFARAELSAPLALTQSGTRSEREQIADAR